MFHSQSPEFPITYSRHFGCRDWQKNKSASRDLNQLAGGAFVTSPMKLSLAHEPEPRSARWKPSFCALLAGDLRG